MREILLSLLFLLTLLTGILWLGQGLRHIELLTTDNLSFRAYLSYVLMLLPKITTLTIPVSMFLAVLINLNRIRTDSELVILWASGESNYSILLKPILVISTFVMILLLFITLIITPYSLNEIRQKIIDIRSTGINLSLLQEKKFISPIETLTIFIQKRDGNKIENLLIHDLKDNSKPQTYIAQKGEFISNPDKKILRLYNGNIQILNNSEKRISEMDFETYDLDLTPYSKSESHHRYSDELFTNEIINILKNKNYNDLDRFEKEHFAELHNRIISPIYVIFFSILPLLALNYVKAPNVSWVLPITCISIFALLIKIVEVTLSNVLIENSSFVYLNYSIPIILIILSTAAISFDLFKRILKNYAIKT